MDISCKDCSQTKGPADFYWKKDGTLRMRICRPCWSARYYAPKKTAIVARVGERKRERNGWPGRRELICEQCGKRYIGQRTVARFCSRDCKDRAKNDALIAARLAAKPERLCRHCGVTLPPTMRMDAAFCSEDCNSAAHRVTSKMRKRGNDPDLTLVSRQQIAERDRWRCGICGGRVKKDLKYPEPMAPSIDHMVPLSKGGDNSPANLQLAHLRCNIVKRDKGSQQLRII